MKYFDMYRHIDNEVVASPFNMGMLAEWAANQNYGTHRLVCALVKAQRKKSPNSKLADALEAAADKYSA